jgi:hypothetical protein
VRFRSLLFTMFLASTTSGFTQGVDVENLARPERIELAKCFSDTLTVIKKHRLVRWLDRVLEAACGVEMERVASAAKNQLKDEFMKASLPSQLVYGMMEKASEIYKQQPVSSCSGTGCSLDEYRTCLMRRMPTAIKDRRKPVDFENLAQHQCEDFESAARSALTNDLDNVLKLHFAGRINHGLNDVIVDITVGARQDVVVLYAEDLVRVQPGRKSCKPEMCGASPCISLEERPTEYQCVINQK